MLHQVSYVPGHTFCVGEAGSRCRYVPSTRPGANVSSFLITSAPPARPRRPHRRLHRSYTHGLSMRISLSPESSRQPSHLLDRQRVVVPGHFIERVVLWKLARPKAETPISKHTSNVQQTLLSGHAPLQRADMIAVSGNADAPPVAGESTQPRHADAPLTLTAGVGWNYADANP
ncbi:hypothetical protein O3P69_020801 [Scylla paramamosain]|uniref:Uncharacterized protein n=1 Tax=Scylla paramamosain TaxID=85552 RepID=A0AAW0TNH1_SCYPA